MGSIGAEVAKLVAVTGAEVIGVRRIPRYEPRKPGLNHVMVGTVDLRRRRAVYAAY